MGFLFASKLDAARAQTRRNQAAAADPAASAWVSANAGTGKTHVLTMRVLRLLLGGTPPERILALTYTKAAAAEMSKRVFARLAEWVMSDEPSLKHKLAQLLGRAPTLADMQRARQLFAVAIETPGGLKVQTIHAFCERLLQRFPIEAGVPPSFAILDEQERSTLLRRATDEMLAAAAAHKSGPLWQSLQTAIAYAVNGGFDNVLQQALAELSAGSRLEGEPALAAAEEELRATFGVRPDIAAEEIIAQLSKTFADDLLAHLVTALRAGNKSDAKGALCLNAALLASSDGRRAEALANFFFTQNNGPRERLLTRKISDERPEIADLLQRAQAKFVALYGEHKGLMVVEATIAVLRLGTDVLDRYSAAKAQNAALDFEDLVGKAAALLASSQAVEWVLYKLDGGLDHILVDEAQDTSPAQWDVIRALAEEFFSGSGAREGVRTLFAVGDEKQSIYSFQGAAPTMFAETGALFARRAELAGLALRRVPLNLSFRAAEPLLAAVDLVFADRARTPGVTSSPVPLQHIAHRTGHAGLVEIWPTERPDQAKPAEPWSPLEEVIGSSPMARLAARIAHTINRWLKSGEVLLSENRPIRAGDILILVRKRTPFAPAMISALKAHGIPVAGADRLVLTEQIAVADLMALGDFLCLPEDDLALANVLKSPLFGLDDAALTALAPSRLAPLKSERDGGGLERPDGLAEPPTLAPSALVEDARFLRGTLTHALLEHLPSLAAQRWPAAAEAFVASRAAQLPATVRKSIVAETLAVLREPAFAPLFGPEARAEIPIVAEIPHPRGGRTVLRLTGKIDRLVAAGDAVLIVDYKTNRPPPKEVGQVSEAYLLQLSAYRLALARIFSQQRVRAAILWTDGPRIMEIPAKILDAAEDRLWQLEGANLDA